MVHEELMVDSHVDQRPKNRRSFMLREIPGFILSGMNTLSYFVLEWLKTLI